jgi:predicted helicase
VQCKLYAEDYRLQKADIDSFFTASGKKTFSHRIDREHYQPLERPRRRGPGEPAAARHPDHPVRPGTEPDRLEPLPAQEAGPCSSPARTCDPTNGTPWTPSARDCKTPIAASSSWPAASGKTFTALKIAEEVAGKNGRVLFLVPSLSLCPRPSPSGPRKAIIPLHCFAVCSDSDVGKKATSEDDAVPVLLHELRYPATTDAKSLAREMAKRHDAAHMSVVFSTYHSIEVLSQAQKKHGLADFDLIVCDEAHRTTGAIFESEDESAFVRVHDAERTCARARSACT